MAHWVPRWCINAFLHRISGVALCISKVATATSVAAEVATREAHSDLMLAQDSTVLRCRYSACIHNVCLLPYALSARKSKHAHHLCTRSACDETHKQITFTRWDKYLRSASQERKWFSRDDSWADVTKGPGHQATHSIACEQVSHASK